MIFEIQISDTEYTKKHMLKLIKVELRYMKIFVILKKKWHLQLIFYVTIVILYLIEIKESHYLVQTLELIHFFPFFLLFTIKLGLFIENTVVISKVPNTLA